MSVKVSIIIPVYNAEKFIGRCLSSIQSQTHDNIEIIVVNDATPDNSMSIVDSFARDDKRINIINNPLKRGAMMARWQGIEIADGEYLTFVDADDYLPDNAIEILLNAIISDNADMAMGTAKVEHIDGSVSYLYNTLPYGSTREAVFHSSLTKQMIYCLWAKLYKTAIFRNHIYDVYENCTMAEDKCLIVQYINNIDKATCVNDVVYHYIKNSNSLTETLFSKKQIEDIILAHKTLTEIVPSYPSLRKLFYGDITYEMSLLFVRKHEKCNVMELLKKHSMTKFVSPIYGVRYLSWKHVWVLLKTFVYNKIYR